MDVSCVPASPAKKMYDNALFGILQSEGQFMPFLDVIFSFLYRNTDFFRLVRDPKQTFGFPPGVARSIVNKVFDNYCKEETTMEKDSKECSNASINVAQPSKSSVLAKEAQMTEMSDKYNPMMSGSSTSVPSFTASDSVQQNKCESESSSWYKNSDCYNGAARDGYVWSQSYNDIDIKVEVDSSILRGKHVRVDVQNGRMKVETQLETGWKTLIDDKLAYQIHADETIWSLERGICIQIHLEKRKERWWDALLENEEKIAKEKIEAVRPMESVPDDEQAVIEKLLYDDHMKKLGKLTSEQQKNERMLRKAWDAEGSPFKDQPFDPSLLNIEDNTMQYGQPPPD